MQDTTMLLSKAEQGDVGAQIMVGMMYEKGIELQQDFIEAFEWFKLAAEQGNSQAQYKVGLMYANGKGVTPDKDEAFKWFNLAAEQGETDAQFNLALMFVDTQNFEDGYKWILLACNKSAGDKFKKYSNIKDDIARNLNNSQILNATKAAKLLQA